MAFQYQASPDRPVQINHGHTCTSPKNPASCSALGTDQASFRKLIQPAALGNHMNSSEDVPFCFKISPDKPLLSAPVEIVTEPVTAPTTCWSFTATQIAGCFLFEEIKNIRLVKSKGTRLLKNLHKL